MTNEELLGIINSISDGVVTVDNDFRISFMNKAAERIIGIDLKEAKGKICREVMETNICDTNCPLQKTLQTGSPIINKSVCLTNFKQKKTPVSISTSILRDKENNVIGCVETFRDLSLVETLRKELEKSYSFEDIIGRSKPMQEIFHLMKIVSQSDSTVLIEGESGTGKELIAKGIYSLSSRKKYPLVAVNCAALPDNLLESELFGYKKGAFTDAKTDKKGLFAAANNGTLFLDEIGEVSPMLQVKLLRTLQEHSYYPLGSTQPEKSNARIIAATNKNISQMVNEGNFRKDFYYRINVIKIKVPSLRERKEDIPLLADHFLAKFNNLNQKNIAGFSPPAMQIIMAHDYPGNVRELENIIEHAFVLSPGGVIKPESLPDSLNKTKSVPAVEIASNMREMEAIFLIAALKRNNWNRTDTARELDINPSTLYRKIKKLGLKAPK